MLRQNVFARAERAHLQHAGGNFKRRKIGWALLVCNLIFAVLPFLATNHYADITFHTLVGLCLIGFCLGYEFHIIFLAIGMIEHEKQNRTWDSLVLTGVHSDRVVVGKWLALVRYSLGTVLLLTISKLAIAYSVMQYLNLHPSWIDIAINNWNRAFVYMSYVCCSSPEPITNYPQVWQVITAFIVLSAISIAEIGTLIGFGILSTFIKTRFTTIKFGYVLVIRVLFSIVCTSLIGFLGQLEIDFHNSHTLPRSDNTSVLWNCEGEFFQQKGDYFAWCVVERDHRRMFEAAQVSAASLADNGVLLAANIMRPIASLQFVLRNMFSAIITLLVIMLIIFLSLLTASRWVQNSFS